MAYYFILKYQWGKKYPNKVKHKYEHKHNTYIDFIEISMFILLIILSLFFISRYVLL